MFPSFHGTAFAKPGWELVRQAARTVLRAGGWGIFAVFLLSSAYLAWWVILALAILGELPASDDVLPTVVPIVLVMTFMISAFVAKFVSSPRRVATVSLTVLAVMWSAELVWAFVAPDRALYTARTVAWGESDVLDYQKFPQRTVDNAAPAFAFRRARRRFRSGTLNTSRTERQGRRISRLSSSRRTRRHLS
jgi:hypothetical protein